MVENNSHDNRSVQNTDKSLMTDKEIKDKHSREELDKSNSSFLRTDEKNSKENVSQHHNDENKMPMSAFKRTIKPDSPLKSDFSKNKSSGMKIL